ncbi:MAG: ABC transporter ATP-binding protein [Planctomycetaceae bacterium]|nr:ABC transporter ATP-binding protein [Planctomycetaceae bacterium]
MIEIKNVTKRYANKTAVDRLNLNVPRGEVFAFLGPNGAGKTTTIKMMVGLLRPDEGTIAIDGHITVSEPRLAAAQIGYIPDQPHLYDKLTGREFLHFMAGMYGMNEHDSLQAIEHQIQIFDLSNFVDLLSETYSHGMKQRLVLAAAMVHRPDVLVLDEPMVGLDPQSMRLVKDLLKTKSKQGATVFMSTHTLTLAEEIADRIGVIQHGEIQFLGTVNELKSKRNQEDVSLEGVFLDLTSESISADRTG